MAPKLCLSPAFVLFLCSNLITPVVQGADTTLAGATRKVDSLNTLAFRQKRSNVPNALNNLFMAQNIASAANYPKGLAKSYMYEAGIFYQNGYDKKALSTYYKALQIFKSIKDTFNIAVTNQQIGLSLQSDSNWAAAMSVYNESLRVYTMLKKKEDIVNIKNAIGLVYLGMNNTSAAEKEFTEALVIAREVKYADGEKKVYYNFGLLEGHKGNYREAEMHFRISMIKDIELGDKYGLALNQLQIANINLKQGRIDSAISMAMNAYSNAYAISANNLLKEASQKVMYAYRNNGDMQKATQWQDSLLKILQVQIDNEKEYALNFIEVIKNQDLQKVNAENEAMGARRVQQEQLLVITVGTFILIIVAVLAVLALVNYQRQRFFGKELKQKNEIIEKNAESLDRLNKEISTQNLMLEEDNKTKNKLLSIISHDLRTPLVNTKGILNLVNQEMVPREEAEVLLQQLETQYIGTTSLLDNLLFWIKGQMNGQENDKVRVNLFLLIKALEDEQRLPLLNKKIQLINNVSKDINIIAEKEMLRIVCRNLISNAIKFTNGGGHIELNARVEETNLYLSVVDSGIGMTKEAIEKVNAKVYYNTTGTAYEKGSGFGLMLCRDLIMKHNGELVVESEPGKGSQFTVILPGSVQV